MGAQKPDLQQLKLGIIPEVKPKRSPSQERKKGPTIHAGRLFSSWHNPCVHLSLPEPILMMYPSSRDHLPLLIILRDDDALDDRGFCDGEDSAEAS